MVSVLNGTDDVIVGIDGFVEIDYAIWRSEYWSAIEFYIDENFQAIQKGAKNIIVKPVKDVISRDQA